MTTSQREIKQPGPDHPITIVANTAHITVSIAGRVVADTHSALTLQEADYPPVQYIPFSDIDQSLLQATEHSSYCPFKGEAGYHSIPVGGERSANAVWSYSDPYPAVAAIKDHAAFYPDRVDEITEESA